MPTSSRAKLVMHALDGSTAGKPWQQLVLWPVRRVPVVAAFPRTLGKQSIPFVGRAAGTRPAVNINAPKLSCWRDETALCNEGVSAA